MTKEARGLKDLESLCDMAGERAAGSGPIARVRPDAEQPRSWITSWRVLLGIGCGLLAFGVVAAQLLSAPAELAKPALEPVVAIDMSATEPNAPAPPVVTVDPIRWESGELRVDVDAKPLDQAIEQLAQTTHSTVSGLQTLHAPVLVTMHWYARDATTAWQLMLKDLATFSAHCDPSSCQIRITGPMGADGHETTKAAADRSYRPASAPGEESQPDGAC